MTEYKNSHMHPQFSGYSDLDKGQDAYVSYSDIYYGDGKFYIENRQYEFGTNYGRLKIRIYKRDGQLYFDAVAYLGDLGSDLSYNSSPQHLSNLRNNIQLREYAMAHVKARLVEILPDEPPLLSLLLELPKA